MTTVFQEKKKKKVGGLGRGKKKREKLVNSGARIQAMHHTRWREEEEAVFCGGLHHRSSKQGPLKRTPVTNMAAATGCSEGLHDARWERILPAPIKMHHACNKVRRKLPEAYRKGDEVNAAHKFAAIR